MQLWQCKHMYACPYTAQYMAIYPRYTAVYSRYTAVYSRYSGAWVYGRIPMPPKSATSQQAHGTKFMEANSIQMFICIMFDDVIIVCSTMFHVHKVPNGHFGPYTYQVFSNAKLCTPHYSHCVGPSHARFGSGEVAAKRAASFLPDPKFQFFSSSYATQFALSTTLSIPVYGVGFDGSRPAHSTYGCIGRWYECLDLACHLYPAGELSFVTNERCPMCHLVVSAAIAPTSQ